ncbi:XTP/dITP diphosphatase [Aquicella lusitana]|uniref:dITP/XTP pyrophosphatase n=1 Tax=Aquicella lusitana TaxID=254246 RepID=A0A370GBX0_9COXI|nr:XTP/dITP diphosphatase [Aquicella lusitana]RDI41322.1 XTP/dITP diphosphohydrolase [Aquicella lusitana]VVC72312.1 dITP/XTP pyrophosphatase [Aquicella lusitana]
MKIVLASNNPGKIQEFSELLKNFHLEIIPQSAFNIAEAEETGLSFIENALIKARHASRLTGLPAIADDSGLVVSALHGAPGIYSARYAGTQANAQDNIKKLLHELKDVPEGNRQAQFHCVLVFVSHEKDPTPLVCDGSWSGTILHEPKGEKGFGYDPVFYVPSEGKAAAELPSTIKNEISHRGQALQILLKRLPEKIHECAFS